MARFSIKRFSLTLLIALVVIAGAAAFFWQYEVAGPQAESQRRHYRVLAQMMQQMTERTPLQLDAKFTDSTGSGVADPPDAAHCVDPETLTFCFVPADDPEKYEKIFQPLVDALSKATGKPVKYLRLKSTDDEVAALASGKLLIAGFNTGAVTEAVNKAGFVPVCMVPPPGGSMQMEILVPSDSPLKSPTDLKGHELTLTEPSSNSGFKAPIVTLKNEFNLEPGRDYYIRISGGQEESLDGLVASDPNDRVEAAAVANDMFNRGIARGDIKLAQVRSIYKSKNFPTACLGYAYNLKPDVAAKVRAALLNFDCKGTPIESEFAPGGATKFIPVNYKEDWAIIRDVDDQIIKMGKDVSASAGS